MATWRCAKCGAAVEDMRAICRACGAARPPLLAPVATAPEPIAEDPDPPEDDAEAGTPWKCAKCGTVVEAGFDVCWECGTSKEGVEDPAFQRIEDEAVPAGDATAVPPDDGPDSEPPPAPPGTPPARKCPSCGTTLVPIRLLDASGKYARYSDLHYAAGDAKEGWFFGYAASGRVGAQMCPACGRIGLYAVPE